MSPSRTSVLSFAHYFQAPATQATLSGTGVISNVLETELHHLNSPKDKEVNEIQVQHGEVVCGLCMKKCYRGIPVGLNLFTVIIFSSS